MRNINVFTKSGSNKIQFELDLQFAENISEIEDDLITFFNEIKSKVYEKANSSQRGYFNFYDSCYMMDPENIERYPEVREQLIKLKLIKQNEKRYRDNKETIDKLDYHYVNKGDGKIWSATDSGKFNSNASVIRFDEDYDSLTRKILKEYIKYSKDNDLDIFFLKIQFFFTKYYDFDSSCLDYDSDDIDDYISKNEDDKKRLMIKSYKENLNRQNNEGETHYSSILKKINDFFRRVDINNRIITAKVKCKDILFKHIFYNFSRGDNIFECMAKYLMKYFEKITYEDKNYNFNVDTIEFHLSDFDNDTSEYYDVETIKIILEKPYEEKEDDDEEKEEDDEDDDIDENNCCLIYEKS